MGERAGYEHGIPNWVDLATTDVEAAKDFYAELFGWAFEDLEGYSLARKDGKLVAGLSALPPGVTQPIWASYLAVADVDEAATAAAEHGGTVDLGPMDALDSARIAFIRDPTGAALGLWQARKHFGAELVNAPGAFVWSDLITDDTAAAQEFYTTAFGMTAETVETAAGPYTVFKVGDHMAAGMIAKNDTMGPIPNYWGVYFGVDDVEASLEVVTAGGGTVLRPPFEVPGVGRMAVIGDPQGGVITIMRAERYDP